MALAVIHADAERRRFDPVAGLVIVELADAGLMASIQGRAVEQIAARFQSGHRAYVAYMNGLPAAFGWVATRTAEIGELGAQAAAIHHINAVAEVQDLRQLRGNHQDGRTARRDRDHGA